MEEKIPTVKDDDDIEKKPPAVKDGGNNEKKPPAVKDPTEIAMKLIMESMGYSPDSCHPEVVNKLKDVMKQCVTPRIEQHASSTAAAQVPPEPETPVIDVPPELQQQFKLLASLSLPLLKAPDPNSRFDEGGVTRGNLLRQLTT
eukprot:scaffold3807_cov232-Skeletonema_marinoi.AAC.2